VDFKFTHLPIFGGATWVNDNILNFKLLEGYSAETSGGLMTMVPPENAEAFMKELEDKFGQ